jgi:hypothetical protein
MTPTPANENDQLSRSRRELEEGTWVKNARERSRRRKSAWNLLLPLFALPLWCTFTFLLGWAALALHTLLRPEAVSLFASGSLRLSTALVLFPIMFSALCPALLLTNFLVYLIPPARRAMNAEDRDYPGTDYDSSRRALSKLGFWICVASLPVVLVGVSIA